MNSQCNRMDTRPDLSGIERQAEDIILLQKAFIGLFSNSVLSEMHAVVLFLENRRMAKRLDLAMKDADAPVECLAMIRDKLSEALDNVRKIRANAMKYRFLFLTNRIFRQTEEDLEERLDTLRLATEPGLADALTRYIDHLETTAPEKPKDWRAEIMSL